MKLWIDDVRPAPEGWTWGKNYWDAIMFMMTDYVTHLSLDHDLGMEQTGEAKSGIVSAKENTSEKTGYDIACWIETNYENFGTVPPIMYCHSANPVGRKRIEQVIEKLRKATQ